MGGSDSSSSSTSSALQQTAGSGAVSPAIHSSTAYGDSTVNIDAGQDVSLAAMSDMTTIVQRALDFGSGLVGRQTDAAAAQSVNDSNLLSSILATNSQLAQNSQTGGATAAISQTNYIIWGLIGLAGTFIVAFLFRKK